MDEQAPDTPLPNPWFAVWTRPLAALREMLERAPGHRAWSVILVLAASSGAYAALSQEGTDTALIWSLVVLPPVVVLQVLFLVLATLALARGLGSRLTFRASLGVYGWALVPSTVYMLFILPLTITHVSEPVGEALLLPAGAALLYSVVLLFLGLRLAAGLSILRTAILLAPAPCCCSVFSLG